jgi:hypothetical protein
LFADQLVATTEFWESYLPFATRIASTVESVGSQQAVSTFLPFLLQRLPGIFLSSVSGANFRVRMITPAGRKAQVNTHLKLLSEMKDAAIKSGSRWLAACWVNYRNLYLVSSRESEWVKENLKNITPTDISFPTSSAKIEVDGALKERIA